MRLFKNQKGFTLIELLVVVAILGILVAIVVPQVTKFIGSGSLAAANAELHTVRTAVTAYMADQKLSRLPEAVTIPDVNGSIVPFDEFISGTKIQGKYFINTDGSVEGITYPELIWDEVNLEWKAPAS